MAEGNHTLAANGVADFYGNIESGQTRAFDYADNSVPAGYYASAEGLTGTPLKAALHNIIKNHVVWSYDHAWTAFYTSDDKPNGKVWDIYSDVPGGIPFYEYTFGVDQGGVGGQEGTGYTREHSFPKSWFGGEVSPMYSDVFILYPCDTHVNGNRGNYAYGEAATADWTSLNGSVRGASAVPGFTGTVFEPIDDFKGDLARAYFYVSTRYYTEDAAWPDGPMTSGAEFLPWAVDMLLLWHFQDPVSQKEIDRNGAIYRIQQNRNPFVDRPEFVSRMFMTSDVDDAAVLQFVLAQNAPNPFAGTTTISFTLPQREEVELAIYDIGGRLIRSLASGAQTPGSHQVAWDGRDAAGRAVGPGVYFYSLEAGALADQKRMLLLK
jgi:endonuclease I